MRSAKLGFESLEQKTPLAADIMLADWHNETSVGDVNGDGVVTPADVLRIVNLMVEMDSTVVADIQQQICDQDPESDKLNGWYFPDSNADGAISATDAVISINRLITQNAVSDHASSVMVTPDANGRPASLVYASEDGRTKTVDLTRISGDVAITRDEGNVFISAASDDGMEVMAKRGIGVLEANGIGDDREAVVTRYPSNGDAVTERYVCIPIIGDDFWLFDDWPTLSDPPPEDVRDTIEGFEEAIGAIVSRETLSSDGTLVTERYRNIVTSEEREVTALRSIVVEPQEGSALEVTYIAIDQRDPAFVASEVDKIKFVLDRGYQSIEPISSQELGNVYLFMLLDPPNV